MTGLGSGPPAGPPGDFGLAKSSFGVEDLLSDVGIRAEIPQEVRFEGPELENRVFCREEGDVSMHAFHWVGKDITDGE